MNNHSGGRNRRDGALLRATRTNFRELLRGRLDERRRQKLQATQAYSEMYWQMKLRDIIIPEWNQKRIDEPELPKTNYLAFMNMRVRELYEAEPDDVKAEVDHYRSTVPAESATSGFLLPEEESLDDEEKARRTKAREIQS